MLTKTNKKILPILVAIIMALMLFFSTVYAVLAPLTPPPSGGYTSTDAILDPGCGPTDTDCFVNTEYTFSSPLTESGHVVTLPAASLISDGYLSSTDFNTFANKEDGFGAGTSGDYLRGDKTWATLDTSVVPENGNLYWTNNRFDTRLATTTSIPNLQTIGTITSGVWHGSQITDAYISDSITASNYIPLSQKGAANGVASLDSAGKILSSQLSSFSLSDTFVVNSEAEMLGLSTADLGDVAIRLDINKSFILTTSDPSNLNNWQEIITPLNHVIAVNGQTGAVNLTTTDIPEGLNLYYTDTRVDDYLNTQKGVANGIASLDANGKIPTSQLGSIILNETHVVPDIPAMLAITGASNGDLAVVTSTDQTFVLADDNNPSNINSWVEIMSGVPVTSVNGQVGSVTLTTTNITEGSNKYFTDTRARNALSATGPLTYSPSTGVFGINQANAISNGYLSAGDWSTFNSKQSALTFGNLTAGGNPEITITGGTGAVIGGGVDITIPDASDTVRGLVTTTAQQFAGTKNFIDGLGVGDATPSELFSVGNGGLFQVNSSGDLVKINNVSYSWPITQGATGSVLVNDSSGGLTWSSNGVISINGDTAGSQTFATGVSGSDFGIATSAGITTFNIPNSSASARGVLSSADWTTFNKKPVVDSVYNSIISASIGAGATLNGVGGGINNLLLGYQSGDTLSTGSNNIFLGYQSGKGVTTGVSHSVYEGFQAGLNATSAANSNFIGYQAGSGATTASFANFLGFQAGQNATNAANSIFIGQTAGYTATGASFSNFIGTSAGYQAIGTTTANFIGYGAGYTASDADYSNFIGRLAGNAASNSQYSNFLGFQAGYNATNAANSIFIGKNAGNGDTVNNVTSGSSIAIGDSAGTGGFSNSIALGANAVNTVANQFLIGSTYTNVSIGGVNYVWPTSPAGGSGYTLSNTGGTLSWVPGVTISGTSGQLQYNNAGSLAGVSGVSYNGANLDANDATLRIVNWGDTTKRAIFDAGYIDPGTTRTYSFPNAAGTLALATVGTSGSDANYSNGILNLPTASASNRGLLSSADWTTFNNKLSSISLAVIGSSPNANGATVSGSTFNLEPASAAFGGVVTTGAQTFAGRKTFNTGLTFSAGTASVSPLLFTAGTNLTTATAGTMEYDGSSLMFTPSGTLRSGILMTDNTSYNTYTSFLKGATAFTSGARNTLIGYQAGNALTTGNNNAFIGYQAGLGGAGMTDNNAIGYQAGYNATAAASSNFIGYQAGSGATNAYAVNFIGQNAGGGVTSAGYANFIGYSAGYGASHASQANFMGFSAGYGAHSAQYANFFGSNAGSNASYAANSNFMGQNAGNGATNASNSTFFGNAAGFNATNANDSIFIGQNAGRNASGASESIFMGKGAGYNGTSTGITGDWNIGLGTGVGMALTTGSYNVLLGYQTSDALTTGSKNIAIGYNIDLPSNTTDGQLTIGNLLFGTGIDGTGTTLSTGKIGIGVAAPAQRLDVVGAAADTTVMRIATTSGNACTFSTTTGVFSCASDSRLKHDISSIDSVDALTKLGQLNPVTYRYNWQTQNDPLISGFIAQEFETVFPELVTTDSVTGYKSLSYAPLMPYAIKAIQELDLKITDIGIMEKQNSWRDALIAWFGNAANGITEFFSKKVSTEELCVKDSAGQTCITRSQLDALLNGQGVPTPPPSNPDPTPSPDPITCIAPEVLNSDGTACETPSSGDPAPGLDPDPVPPTDNSDPGPAE